MKPDAAAGTRAGDAATRLFVYGSLRHGQGNQMAALLRRHATHLGTGTVCARLYTVDWYPGMTLSAAPDDCVTGDLFALHPPTADALLAALDDYEGDGFIRREVRVSVAEPDGGETLVSALAYLYAGSVAGLERVAGGDWSRRPHPAPRGA